MQAIDLRPGLEVKVSAGRHLGKVGKLMNISPKGNQRGKKPVQIGKNICWIEPEFLSEAAEEFKPTLKVGDCILWLRDELCGEVVQIDDDECWIDLYQEDQPFEGIAYTWKELHKNKDGFIKIYPRAAFEIGDIAAVAVGKKAGETYTVLKVGKFGCTLGNPMEPAGNAWFRHDCLKEPELQEPIAEAEAEAVKSAPTEPSRSEFEELQISDILKMPSMQMRMNMDSQAIAMYKEMLEYSDPPPVEVVRVEGTGDILTNGFHRCESSTQAGRKTIRAKITHGTITDAYLAAATANSYNGLQLSTQERRIACTAYLKALNDLPDGDSRKDEGLRSIAAKVGCSYVTVKNIKDELHAKEAAIAKGFKVGALVKFEQPDLTRIGEVESLADKTFWIRWITGNGQHFKYTDAPDLLEILTPDEYAKAKEELSKPKETPIKVGQLVRNAGEGISLVTGEGLKLGCISSIGEDWLITVTWLSGLSKVFYKKDIGSKLALLTQEEFDQLKTLPGQPQPTSTSSVQSPAQTSDSSSSSSSSNSSSGGSSGSGGGGGGSLSQSFDKLRNTLAAKSQGKEQVLPDCDRNEPPSGEFQIPSEKPAENPHTQDYIVAVKSNLDYFKNEELDFLCITIMEEMQRRQMDKLNMSRFTNEQLEFLLSIILEEMQNRTSQSLSNHDIEQADEDSNI